MNDLTRFILHDAFKPSNETIFRKRKTTKIPLKKAKKCKSPKSQKIGLKAKILNPKGLHFPKNVSPNTTNKHNIITLGFFE